MGHSTTLGNNNSSFNWKHKIHNENAYASSLQITSCKCLRIIRCFLSSRAALPTAQEFRLPSDPGQYRSAKIIVSQPHGASMHYKQLPEHQRALAYNSAWSYVRLGSDDSPCTIRCFLLSWTALPYQLKYFSCRVIQSNTDALRS